MLIYIEMTSGNSKCFKKTRFEERIFVLPQYNSSFPELLKPAPLQVYLNDLIRLINGLGIVSNKLKSFVCL
ncbi:TPA: hypothetical protein DHW51_01940, partial [Candidatus Poribacteria bacterium]|nr:hypothetical protein [Candidatus Poribacteria bacterium]